MSDEATQSGAGAEAELAGMFDDTPVEKPKSAPETSDDYIEIPDDGAESGEGDDDGDEIEVDDEDHDDSDPEIELKIDGETKKVKQSEINKQAQKFYAAEKRFEEAAAIRKEAEAIKSTIPEREKQLATVLTHYIQQAQAMMPQEPNWRQLLEQDPHNYQRVRLDWEQRIGEINQAKQAEAVLKQRESEATAASNQQRILGERDELVKAIPDWKDPSKAAEGAKAIDGYLTAQGIPAEIRGSIDDHRLILIARKAMLYDQALSRKQQAQTATKQPLRTERTGVSSQATPKAQTQKVNAAKAFKANPSVDTLASFFK